MVFAAASLVVTVCGLVLCTAWDSTWGRNPLVWRLRVWMRRLDDDCFRGTRVGIVLGAGPHLPDTGRGKISRVVDGAGGPRNFRGSGHATAARPIMPGRPSVSRTRPHMRKSPRSPRSKTPSKVTVRKIGRRTVYRLRVPPATPSKVRGAAGGDPRLAGALDLQDWIDKTKAVHLRAGDVMRLRKGQTLRLTFLDRNVGDVVLSPALAAGRPAPNRRYSAKRFLRNAEQGVFTSDGTGGLTGTIRWRHGTKSQERPFAFEPFDAKRGLWHPGNKVASAHTRVGWRGPAILTALLPTLPDMTNRYQ